MLAPAIRRYAVTRKRYFEAWANAQLDNNLHDLALVKGVNSNINSWLKKCQLELQYWTLASRNVNWNSDIGLLPQETSIGTPILDSCLKKCQLDGTSPQMHLFETDISVLQQKYFVISRSKECHPLHPTLFLICFPSNFDPVMGLILGGELWAQA